jgi:ubiquinone/menaquinone biosynthesis C-methylase UbiE
MAEEIREAYDKRAPTYDETTFHRDLAEAYVTYVDPKPGESLLDLACGTGLVTFNLARILQPREDGAVERRGKIVGVDISRGMLDVARRKLEMRGNEDEELRMRFIEGDIAKLDGIEAVEEGGFDIITVCSALVLMPEPREAVRYWARYLRPGGGRLIMDIPSTKSMLALKILDFTAPEFGISMLGKRSWIYGPESLQCLMEDAGLESKVMETGIWDGIPSRTEEGRVEWGEEEGGRIWDLWKEKGGFGGLREGMGERARERFESEWRALAGTDGKVREEGRLYIGVGWKR